MKFFERTPKPQANSNAENRLREAVRQHDAAERSLNYSTARAEANSSLLQEKIRFQIALGNADQALKAARSRNSHATERQHLQQQIYELQLRSARLHGTPEPTPPSSVSTDDTLQQRQAEYDAAKKELDDLHAQIEKRDAELRLRFGIE